MELQVFYTSQLDGIYILPKLITSLRCSFFNLGWWAKAQLMWGVKHFQLENSETLNRDLNAFALILLGLKYFLVVLWNHLETLLLPVVPGARTVREALNRLQIIIWDFDNLIAVNNADKLQILQIIRNSGICSFTQIVLHHSLFTRVISLQWLCYCYIFSASHVICT